MYEHRHKVKWIYIIMLATVLLLISSFGMTAWVMPKQLTIIQGQEYIYQLYSLLPVKIIGDEKGLVKLKQKDSNLQSIFLNSSEPITMAAEERGSTSLQLKLFGVIPVRKMKVDVVTNKKLIACGNTVGVKLSLQGVLVIGVTEIKTKDGRRVTPSKDCGLKQGDLLLEVNHAKLDSISVLKKAVSSSGGGTLQLKYKRGDIYGIASLKPEIAEDDNQYHVGLWVRDSTAGIGTLTFYDAETKIFGALGHGITDIDTGALMPIEKGEIFESNILGIKKGKQGVPGELRGVMEGEKPQLGNIKVNNECGIYGTINDGSESKLNEKSYPIGLRNQIREGPAKILSNIDGKKVEEFDIEIQKVSKTTINGTKGMIIRIVDQRLLELTGGIVQGMSGSPIIQDNRLIGAVTHVLLNKPDTGYGIFIESMLRNLPNDWLKTVDQAG